MKQVNIVRLQDVMHSQNRFHLAFEYLKLDLKKHMDSSAELANDPHLIQLFLY
uniref:Uncharacterized protein n=1 Tax=Nelumbo nucifera TaxID=4432 RepID=A0A822ZM02_NELNU|nr:TPA_asm: hypothetical protein HUJ06_003730 [Nelumbo nucifera]